MIGSYKGIKLGSTDSNVICTILGYVDGITVGVDVGPKPGSLNGSFDVSNDGNLEGLLLGGKMKYDDGKVLGSDTGIKLG